MSAKVKFVFSITLAIFLGFEAWYYLVRIPRDRVAVETASRVFEKYVGKRDLQNWSGTVTPSPLRQRLAEGHWSFVFIGYTSCPDVCPLTLGILAKVFTILNSGPALTAPIRGVFVAIDQGGEAEEDVKKFTRKFDHRILAFLPKKAEFDSFVTWLKAGYAPGDGRISHSTSIYLIDPIGALIGEFANPRNAEEIASEFNNISRAIP